MTRLRTIKLVRPRTKAVTGWLCGGCLGSSFIYIGPRKELFFTGAAWKMAHSWSGDIYYIREEDYSEGDIIWPNPGNCVRAKMEVPI